MFAYRLADSEDRAFILSGWSASLRMSRDVQLITMADWADIMRPVIAKVLDRPDVVTVIAHSSVLCGFICAEPGYVYYVYVAQPFRRNGLARRLLASVNIDPESHFSYACRTKGSWEVRSKIPLAKYDPYRARFPKDEYDRR